MVGVGIRNRKCQRPGLEPPTTLSRGAKAELGHSSYAHPQPSTLNPSPSTLSPQLKGSIPLSARGSIRRPSDSSEGHFLGR